MRLFNDIDQPRILMGGNCKESFNTQKPHVCIHNDPHCFPQGSIHEYVNAHIPNSLPLNDFDVPLFLCACPSSGGHVTDCCRVAIPPAASVLPAPAAVLPAPTAAAKPAVTEVWLAQKIGEI